MDPATGAENNPHQGTDYQEKNQPDGAGIPLCEIQKSVLIEVKRVDKSAGFGAANPTRPASQTSVITYTWVKY